MEFSRQEYWSGLLFPSPGDFPGPGIKPWSPASQVESLLPGNSLEVQWLGLCAFTAKDLSLIPGLGTKIPQAVPRQAPLSMGFSRQEYWSGLPFPSPGDLPYPLIEPWSPALQADSLPSEPPGKPC